MTALAGTTLILRQSWTLARRQVTLIRADRTYLAFLCSLPFILGALALTVPGSSGMGYANAHTAPNEPAQVLMLLIVSATFMGSALGIRDLIGERTIFHRERAVGLSGTAYVLAKVSVYGLIAMAQTGILCAIVLFGKGEPQRGALMVGNATVELCLVIAATALLGVLSGLTMSAVASSQDQVLPMLVVSTMLSIVFSGGLIPVGGRPLLDQISWILPARWGFAASAATVDLSVVAPLIPVHDPLWSHSVQGWRLDMCVMAAIAAMLLTVLRTRMRLRRTSKRIGLPAEREPEYAQAHSARLTTCVETRHGPRTQMNSSPHSPSVCA